MTTTVITAISIIGGEDRRGGQKKSGGAPADLCSSRQISYYIMLYTIMLYTLYTKQG